MLNIKIAKTFALIGIGFGVVVSRQLKYLEAHMATSEQIAELTSNVDGLLSKVTELKEVITTETEQQATFAEQQLKAINDLKTQIANGAPSAEVQESITKLKESNSQLSESIARAHDIVPDAQAAVDAVQVVSEVVASETAASNETATSGEVATETVTGETPDVQAEAA